MVRNSLHFFMFLKSFVASCSFVDMFSDVFRFGPCLFCKALRSLSFVSFVFSSSVTYFLCIPCAALLLRELVAAMLQLPHIFLLLRRVHSSVAEASDGNFAASSLYLPSIVGSLSEDS